MSDLQTDVAVVSATGTQLGHTQTSNSFYELARDENKVLDLLEKFKGVNEMKVGIPLNISVDYLDFVLGKAYRLMFMGTSKRYTTSGLLQSVTLVQAITNPKTDVVEGFEVYQNAAVKLVTALENIERGAMVEVTWYGQKPTKSGGQMRLFKVYKLTEK